MHQMGLIVWANAIVYSYRAVLSAGHNDGTRSEWTFRAE